MSNPDPRPIVRAVHCRHSAADDLVYHALCRATDPLTNAWLRLQDAKRIGIKINQDYAPEERAYFHGQLLHLVSERVARATFRLLRERTDAELLCVDTSATEIGAGRDPLETASVLHLCHEFGVEYVNANRPPFRRHAVPGGGLMFGAYLLPEAILDVDEFVSVAKMKNHGFMGITLCLKNLFGLVPAEPHGHPRQYYHHLVRMPYVLADLGRILNPALNIVDGLVAHARNEWGPGTPLAPDALVAGEQVIATDACTAHLMGHDPAADWLTPPFHRDRNALLVAAEAGFGTVDLAQIDFESEVSRPLGEFYSRATDPPPTTISWRRTTAEQGLHYQTHRDALVDQYAGEYILLQDGEVRWHDAAGTLHTSRRDLAGTRPDHAMWLKYVDPEETEDERYQVYENTLTQMDASCPIDDSPASHD